MIHWYITDKIFLIVNIGKRFVAIYFDTSNMLFK